MAMGRGFRAFHTQNPTNPGGYSIVLEQRGKNDVVLFENYAVATMSKFYLVIHHFTIILCQIVIDEITLQHSVTYLK